MSGKKRPEKPPIEMTTKELAERLFGKPLKRKLDEIAREKDGELDPNNSSKE